MTALTTTQTTKLIKERFPNVPTVSAGKTHWSVESIGEYDRYELSVQPGFDGDTCQTFYSEESFEACIASLDTWLKLKAEAPATRNDE